MICIISTFPQVCGWSEETRVTANEMLQNGFFTCLVLFISLGWYKGRTVSWKCKGNLAGHGRIFPSSGEERVKLENKTHGNWNRAGFYLVGHFLFFFFLLFCFSLCVCFYCFVLSSYKTVQKPCLPFDTAHSQTNILNKYFLHCFGGHRTTTWTVMGTLWSQEKWEQILKKGNVHGS